MLLFAMSLKLCIVFSSASVRPMLLLLALLAGGERRCFPSSLVTGFKLLPGTGLEEATVLGNEEEREGAAATRVFCMGLGEATTVLVTNGLVLACAGLVAVAEEAGFLTCCLEASAVVVIFGVGLVCFFGAVETFALVILLTAPLSFAVAVCGEDVGFSLPGKTSLLLVAIR